MTMSTPILKDLSKVPDKTEQYENTSRLIKKKIITRSGNITKSIRNSPNPKNIFEVFSFHILDNYKTILREPIQFSNSKGTALQRTLLNLNEDTLYEMAGSRALSTCPSKELFNLLIFLGYGELVTRFFQDRINTEPSDTDSQIKSYLNDVEKRTLKTLRHLATILGIPCTDNDSIEELRLKLNIVVVNSWGGHTFILLKKNDLGFGRFIFYQFKNSNLHLVFDLSTLTEEMEGLNLRIESIKNNFIQAFILKGLGWSKTSKKISKQLDYHTLLDDIIRSLLGGFTDNPQPFLDFQTTFFDHFNVQWAKVAQFINNAVKSHCKGNIDLAKTLVQFQFELSCPIAQECQLDEIWKGLFPNINKHKNFNCTNPIGFLRRLNVHPDMIATPLCMGGQLMRSISAEFLLDHPTLCQTQFTEYHRQHVQVCIFEGRYHLKCELSILRWCKAITEHYLKRPELHHFEVTDALMTLFESVCDMTLLQGHAYPVMERYKGILSHEIEQIPPYLESFIDHSDIIVQLSALSFGIVLLTLNSTWAESFLIERCLPLLKNHPHPLFQRFYTVIREKILPFIEIEEEDIQGFDLISFNVEIVPQSRGATPSLGKLRKDVYDSTQDQDATVKAIIEWGIGSLNNNSIKGTTLCNLFLGTPIEKKIFQTNDLESFFFILLENLVWMRSPEALEKAVDIIKNLKISTDYFKQFKSIILRLKMQVQADNNGKHLKETLIDRLIYYQLKIIQTTPKGNSPHFVIKQIFYSPHSFNQSNLQTLQELAPKVMKWKHHNLQDATEWLFHPSAFQLLGPIAWTKSALYWLQWTEINQFDLPNCVKLLNTLLEHQVKNNPYVTKIIHLFLTKKLFSECLQDPTKRWKILEKISVWLDNTSTPYWIVQTLALTTILKDQKKEELIADIYVHPLMKLFILTKHSESIINNLLTSLLKQADDGSSSAVLKLMQTYPSYSNRNNWTVLWKNLTTSKNKDLIERAFKHWLETFPITSIDSKMASLPLLALHRIDSTSFKFFLKSPFNLLEVLNQPVIHKNDLLNICEKILVIYIKNPEKNPGIEFKNILTLYLKFQPLPSIQICLYTLRTYPKIEQNIYKIIIQSTAHYLHTHSNDTALPHKNQFSAFISQWNHWPETESAEIRNSYHIILEVLLKHFPQERDFYQKCFDYLLNKNNFHLVLFLTVHQQLLDNTLNSKISTILALLLTHSEQVPLEWISKLINYLESFKKLSPEDSDVLNAIWARLCKRYLELSHTHPHATAKTCQHAIELFQKKYTSFSAIQEENKQLIDPLVDALIAISKKFNLHKQFFNLITQLFLNLLKTNYLYLFKAYEKFLLYKPVEKDQEGLLFAELSWIGQGLLLHINELSDHLPAFKKSIINYFYYPDISSLDYTVDPYPLFKDTFSFVISSGLFKNFPQTLQELEFLVCNGKSQAMLSNSTSPFEAFKSLADNLANSGNFPIVANIFINSCLKPGFYPNSFDEEFECIKYILDKLKSLITSSTFEPYTFMSIGGSLCFIDVPEVYIFGTDSLHSQNQVKALQLHSYYFHIALTITCSNLQACSKNQFGLFLKGYIIRLNKHAHLFHSNDPKLQTEIWNEYHCMIVNLFKIYFLELRLSSQHNPSEEDIIAIAQLLDLLIPYATGKRRGSHEELPELKDIGNEEQRCTLFFELMLFLNDKFHFETLILSEISLLIPFLPIVKYHYKAEELSPMIPKAMLNAYPNEEFAFKEAINHANESFERAQKNEIINKEDCPHIFLSLFFLFEVIQNSLTLSTKEHWKKGVELLLDRCQKMEINHFQIVAEFATVALRYPLPIQDKKFYLELLKKAFNVKLNCRFEFFQNASEKEIFEIKDKEFIDACLKDLFIHENIQVDIIKGSPHPFHELVAYFHTIGYKDGFHKVFWIGSLFKLFPEIFAVCWKKGAEMALVRMDYESSLRFLTELARHDHTLLVKDNLYTIASETLRCLSFPLQNQSLLEEFAPLFLDNAPSQEYVTYLANLLWKILLIDDSFNLKNLKLSKLKVPLIQRLESAKNTEAEDINRQMRIFLRYERSPNDSDTIQLLILVLIDYFRRVNYLTPIPEWISSFKKEVLKKGRGPCLQNTINFAKSLLNQFYQNCEHTHAILWMSTLQKLALLEKVPSDLFKLNISTYQSNSNTEKAYSKAMQGWHKNKSCENILCVCLGMLHSPNYSTMLQDSYKSLHYLLKLKDDKLNPKLIQMTLVCFLTYPFLPKEYLSNHRIQLFNLVKQFDNRGLFKKSKIWDITLHHYINICTKTFTLCYDFPDLIPNVKTYLEKRIDNNEECKKIAQSLAHLVVKLYKMDKNKEQTKHNIYKLIETFPVSPPNAATVFVEYKQLSFEALANDSFETLTRVSLISMIMHEFQSIDDFTVSIMYEFLKTYPSALTGNLSLAILCNYQFSTVENYKLFIENSFKQVLQVVLKTCTPEQEFLIRCYIYKLESSQIEKTFDKFLGKLGDKIIYLCRHLFSLYIEQRQPISCAAIHHLFIVLNAKTKLLEITPQWPVKLIAHFKESVSKTLPVHMNFSSICILLCKFSRDSINEFCEIFINTLVQYQPTEYEQKQIIDDFLKDCFVTIIYLRDTDPFRNKYPEIVSAITPWLTRRYCLETNEESQLTYASKAFFELTSIELSKDEQHCILDQNVIEQLKLWVTELSKYENCKGIHTLYSNFFKIFK